MNTLDELQQRYKQASSDEERKSILLEAKLLKGELYQCYYQEDYTDPKTRCKNYQEDYWCSNKHRIAWQESNYIDKRERGERRLTIPEIQKRLKEMAERKYHKGQTTLL